MELPPNGPRLKAMIIGACVRGDRETLRMAVPGLGERLGLSDARVLGELFDWILMDADPEGESIAVDDLERLPVEALEILVVRLAQITYTELTSSRAS